MAQKPVFREHCILYSSRLEAATRPGDTPGVKFVRRYQPTEISGQPSQGPKHDIYRHPQALELPAESFSAAMDLYSLGTILLEIAEWRALQYLVNTIADIDAAEVPRSKWRR